MAKPVAEKLFNVNNIQSAKKIFEICPKFLDFMIINGETNAAIRSHPCAFSLPTIKLPDRIDRAAAKYLRDVVLTDPKHLRLLSKSLNIALLSRNLLLEKDMLTYARKNAKKKCIREPEMDVPDDVTQYIQESDDPAMEEMLLMNSSNVSRMHKLDVDTMVKKELEDMALPIRYGTRLSNLYLVGRLAPNFAATCRVFYEIRKRCPMFSPESLFDFGSGLGSATWAANSVWPINTIKEHFMIDASTNLLAISEYLLKDGLVKQHLTAFPNVTFRSYLPASHDLVYDIVVSAYSLLDISGGYLNRREIISSLWRKTTKFLVLVDYGSKGGFQAILEARNWLLSSTKNDETPAVLFAPCPHSLACPKAEQACTFSTKYLRLQLTESSENVHNEFFSYVIFHKGDISEYQDASQEILKGYPRNVSYKVDGNVQDLCMKDGEVVRYFITSKQRAMKRYLARCKPGDMVPLIRVDDGTNDNNDGEDSNNECSEKE